MRKILRMLGVSDMNSRLWSDRPWWLIFGILTGLTLGYAVFAGGCNGYSAIVGGTTTIKKAEKVTTPDGTVTETIAEAQSTGASAKASGEKNTAEVSGTPAELTLPGGGSAKGGGFDGSAASSARFTSWGMIGVGVLFFIGAGGAFYLQLRQATIVLAVGGVAFIAIGLYPALLLWCLALGVIGGGVYLYSEYGNRLNKEGLRAVVAGVAELKNVAPDAYEKAKAFVASHAEPRDVATIEKIKREDGI